MRLIGEEKRAIRRGNPVPLGVSAAGKWTNLAVSVPEAERVILHVFAEAADEPHFSIVLTEEDREGSVFAVQIQTEAPDICYQYELEGRCFVDPYAPLVTGGERYGVRLSAEQREYRKGVLRLHRFDWRDDKAPGVAQEAMVLYELHVRGFSKCASKKSGAVGGPEQSDTEQSAVVQSAVARRDGTYSGVTAKARYLQELGVNAVLLMPCVEFDEYERAGMNYWGYTESYYYFAPKASYAADASRADVEFKTMVRTLHRCGIEVLMEMYVPEGANRTMVLDALRYWAREYHIDGFRINLERMDGRLLAEDPYLSKVKLLGGYWDSACRTAANRLFVYNDGFELDTRRFLRGDYGMAPAFSYRVTNVPGRATALNFITDHNGFTLADLYSYSVKHNEANSEGGRDGRIHNFGQNCGVEGPTKRRKVLALRDKLRKNAMVTLLLSVGTPMLRAGDEFGNSQGGNNNAYCQDNEVSWLDWSGLRKDKAFWGFVRDLIRLRRDHPVFGATGKISNEVLRTFGMPRVSVHSTEAWRPDGEFHNRCVGILLCGAHVRRADGEPDDTFYVMYNMSEEERAFAVPRLPKDYSFRVALCTENGYDAVATAGQRMTVPAQSIVVLQSEYGFVEK